MARFVSLLHSFRKHSSRRMTREERRAAAYANARRRRCYGLTLLRLPAIDVEKGLARRELLPCDRLGSLEASGVLHVMATPSFWKTYVMAPSQSWSLRSEASSAASYATCTM